MAARHSQSYAFGARGMASPARLLISLGVIATFAMLIARRPVAAGLVLALAAAGLAGFCLYGYVAPGGTNVRQIEAAASVRTELPPPRPPEMPSVRPNPDVAATPPSPAKDNAAATPPAKPVAPKSASTARDPALANWFVASYLKCWSPPVNLPQGEKYGAQIRIVHRADGSLAGAPRLVNPPTDPEWRPYADSALRAVAKCNPLHVPPQYAAQFDQWRKMTLYF